MPTERGQKKVREMSELFASSSLIVAAEYRGIDVSDMGELRKTIKRSDAQFKIVKNTFARIAADDCGKPEIKTFIDGPIGFLTTSSDSALAAKALVKHAEDNSLPVRLLGGWFEGNILNSDQVNKLAKIPAKDELLSKMIGSLNSPIVSLVTVMGGPIRALSSVLKNHIEKQQTQS